MTGLHAFYKELLVSPARLARCTAAVSVAELFALLKRWWRREDWSSASLIRQLSICNQQSLELDTRLLAAHWLPYRYHAKTRSISWCLPKGRPTEPFFDEYIGRCRQLPVNQFLQPKTGLEQASDEMNKDHARAPAGFIFHVSRCGSTLVSGALAELDRVHVLSEPPLLTEALLAPGLIADERRQLLQTLMALQCRRLPASKAVVVKWNAWDLFHWSLIRTLYPRTPVLLLMRDPVEVLASHERRAGRHMAGDPSLAELNQVFSGMRANESLLDVRARVLGSLLDIMNDVCEEPGVMVADYTQLNAKLVRAAGLHFGISMSDTEYLRVRKRMRLHSKEPGSRFRPDGRHKRQRFSACERDSIRRELGPLYGRLSMFVSSPFSEVAAC